MTVLADLLPQELAERLKGFSETGPSKLFRKFVDASGDIEIKEKGVIVRLSKRAHNPLLREAGLTEPTRPVPWLGHRSVACRITRLISGCHLTSRVVALTHAGMRATWVPIRQVNASAKIGVK